MTNRSIEPLSATYRAEETIGSGDGAGARWTTRGCAGGKGRASCAQPARVSIAQTETAARASRTRNCSETRIRVSHNIRLGPEQSSSGHLRAAMLELAFAEAIVAGRTWIHAPYIPKLIAGWNSLRRSSTRNGAPPVSSST